MGLDIDCPHCALLSEFKNSMVDGRRGYKLLLGVFSFTCVITFSMCPFSEFL